MSAIIFFKHCLAPIRFSWLYGFVYDDLGRRRYWGANSTSETYVDDGQDVAFMAGSGAHSYNVFQGLDLDDYFAIAVDSNSAQSILHDGLGSTTGTVNFSGQTTGTNQYSPFGATSSTGSPGAGPFQYTERELDPTGLYYMRNRYYSFGLQRFVSPDPSGFAGDGPNLFSYVGNSPTNLVDRLGLSGTSGGANNGSGQGDNFRQRFGPDSLEFLRNNWIT
jgi:RHS repeat-associated protein